MPKRRVTRNSTAKKRESEVKNQSQEELKRREGIDLMLKDFDKQVEARIAEMEADTESTIKSIHTLYKVELIKLPTSIKNMKWEEYVSQCREEGVYPMPLTNAMDKILGDVTSIVGPKVSLTKPTSKKEKVTGSDGSDSGGEGVRRSNRSCRSTKTLSSSSSLSAPQKNLTTPCGGGRGSTLSAPLKNLTTPCGAGLGSTPFITPRFNTLIPLSRTVSRVARPNETLVSLSGSPVVPLSLRGRAAKAEAENNALIPLGKGHTLNVPIGNEDVGLEGFELDEDARKKLAAIHASLGNMLKIRDSSSVPRDDNE